MYVSLFFSSTIMGPSSCYPFCRKDDIGTNSISSISKQEKSYYTINYNYDNNNDKTNHNENDNENNQHIIKTH